MREEDPIIQPPDLPIFQSVIIWSLTDWSSTPPLMKSVFSNESRKASPSAKLLTKMIPLRRSSRSLVEFLTKASVLSTKSLSLILKTVYWCSFLYDGVRIPKKPLGSLHCLTNSSTVRGGRVAVKNVTATLHVITLSP